MISNSSDAFSPDSCKACYMHVHSKPGRRPKHSCGLDELSFKALVCLHKEKEKEDKKKQRKTNKEKKENAKKEKKDGKKKPITSLEELRDHAGTMMDEKDKEEVQDQITEVVKCLQQDGGAKEYYESQARNGALSLKLHLGEVIPETGRPRIGVPAFSTILKVDENVRLARNLNSDVISKGAINNIDHLVYWCESCKCCVWKEDSDACDACDACKVTWCTKKECNPESTASLHIHCD